MTSSSSTTATPPKLSFDARVGLVKAPKSDINALILDYLTMEGYPKAAANFSKEANLPPQQDNSFVRTRQQIQSAIHRGHIDHAIEALNHYDPELLDQDPTLHFALLRLQLVELIRGCSGTGPEMQPVIQFAQEQLGPRASNRPDFLKVLEETMVMIFFQSDKMPPEQKKLLSPNLRREVADQVNKAILYNHSKRREAAIRQLVKMRAWAENVARDAKKDLPGSIEIGLQGAGERDHDHEAMITT